MDYSEKKDYVIKKEDFKIIVAAVDEWLEKYNKKPLMVALREDGVKVEKYISFTKYQELKEVFDKEKGIGLQIVYEAPKPKKKANKKESKK
ncbi:MAG: hypothetical protein FGO69_10955 [Methanobacterium sp.]|nr:MAG: hypothetical protein FGO69_10955 [Methanobacterium sp.]